MPKGIETVSYKALIATISNQQMGGLRTLSMGLTGQATIDNWPQTRICKGTALVGESHVMS